MLEKTPKKQQLFNKYIQTRTKLMYPVGNELKSILDKILKLLYNYHFREAIFLASPELHHQIIKWENGAFTDKQKIEKLHFSILKFSTKNSTNT